MDMRGEIDLKVIVGLTMVVTGTGKEVSSIMVMNRQSITMKEGGVSIGTIIMMAAKDTSTIQVRNK